MEVTNEIIEERVNNIRSSLRNKIMTPREVRDAVLEDSYKGIISSKEASRRFLFDAGIIDNECGLTSKYR